MFKKINDDCNAGLTPLRITQKYSSRTVHVKEKSRTWRIRELIRREDVSLRASKSFACVKKKIFSMSKISIRQTPDKKHVTLTARARRLDAV
jgi:hypothetical protein